MITQETVTPQNSLLLVMDRELGDIPDKIEGLVAVTPSCIAIGTRSASDGGTIVVLADEEIHLDQSFREVFNGVLETPTREIQVSDVLLEPLVTLPVAGVITSVSIWVDHETEPARVYVFVR